MTSTILNINKKYCGAIILIGFIVILSIIGFLNTWYIKRNGIYTIATITSIGNAGRGGYLVDYKFSYKKQTYESRAGWAETEINKKDVGKRFFLVFLASNPQRHHCLDLAPDCIGDPPPEGWTEIPVCEPLQIAPQDTIVIREPVHIQGSHIRIVPPAGFQVASDFQGLVDKINKIKITVSNEQKSDFFEFITNNGAEKLQKQGIFVLVNEPIKIDELISGQYICYTKSYSGKTYLLIIGNTEFHLTIETKLPFDSKLDAEIEKSLKSVQYVP